MNEKSVKEQYENVGAVIIRGLLSPDEVRNMRAYLDQQFEPLDRAAGGKSVKSLPPSFCWQSPEIIKAALHERVISALKEILELNFSIIGDLEVHRNLYGLKHEYKLSKLFGLIGPGWHYDAGAEGIKDYLLDPEYRMNKCGIYLQDNTVEWGGGIEIVPGSYRPITHTGNVKFDMKAMRMWQNLQIPVKCKRINLRAGDFATFHALLPHRGTLPREIMRHPDKYFMDVEDGVARPPREHTKYVIYYNAAVSKFAHTYLDHGFIRAVKDDVIPSQSGKKIDMFFSDFPGLQYPNDYHPVARQIIESHGLKMAQLNKAHLDEAVARRKAVIASGSPLNYLREWGELPRSAA